jgi:murein DD-endopeptidase MepM/ murein hydrolase activator NlpD
MGLPKCNSAFAGVVSLALVLLALLPQQKAPAILPESGYADPAALPRIEIVEGTVKKNATLVATLVDFEIPKEIANHIASLVQPVFDVRGLHSGNPFKLEKDTNGTLRAFEYKINDEKILEVQRGGGAYEARVSTLELESRETIVTAEITARNNSLYAALDSDQKGGQSAVMLAEKVASIFAWDVDFNSDLQVSDQIKILVPAMYHEGRFVKWGDIQAAELINSGKTYRGFRFEGSFYDAKGNALKRSLLVSPLPFMKVTSGFTRRRLHPILGRSRPHLAVDYGAPTGTPVQAVANGTVTFAGWNEGYGNLVQIKHAGGLTTGYAHLSRIAKGIRSGASVDQGELIGNVGQTGLATGPHLHYMMTKGGQPINPMKMQSEPPVPIDAKLRPKFEAHIAPLAAKLD